MAPYIYNSILWHHIYTMVFYGTISIQWYSMLLYSKINGIVKCQNNKNKCHNTNDYKKKSYLDD